MNGHVVLAMPSLSDAAALTASAQADGMPASNLQRAQPIEVWRTTNPAAAWLVADLGTAAAVNLAALLHTNASATATWRVRAAATESGLLSAPGYDSGALTVWPRPDLGGWESVNAIHWLGAAGAAATANVRVTEAGDRRITEAGAVRVTESGSANGGFRWWRLDLADAANPAGYLQAGRLYLASAWQPARNVSYGWSVGWDDPSAKPRSRGGQTYVVRRPRRRILRFELNFLSEDDAYDQAFEIDRLRGASEDVLVIRDPDSAARLQQWTVYGTLDELAPIVNPSHRIFSKSYVVSEL